MWKIPFFELDYGVNEVSAVTSVLDSRWLTIGEKNSLFEREFSKFLGGSHKCLTVSSCTAALHLALILSDVSDGDEVILPSLNFVAAANMIKALGAKPIFLDAVSLDNMNTSGKEYIQHITNRTKAIIILHFAGYPNDVGTLYDYAKSKGIKVIEDCAHAPGAKIRGQSVGTFGDFGCFSFFSNKNLPIGEGGMISLKDPQHISEIKALRSHGMSVQSMDKHKGRAVSYDVSRVGFNYRLDEIRAALGLVQLHKLHNNNIVRREIVSSFRSALSAYPLIFPFAYENDDCCSAYHINPVILHDGYDRMEFVTFLKEKGVQTSIHYPPFWSFTAHTDCSFEGQNKISDIISAREVTLPLYPTIGDGKVNLAIEEIKRFFDEKA